MLKAWLWARKFSRFMLGSEKLPEDPVAPSSAVSWRLLKALLGPEDLASDPVTCCPKGGYLRRIMEPEELPQDPIQSRRREGFFRTLLKGETLSQEGNQE